jgi:methyltransferase of ATP-grasp peptide maturase system
VTPTTSDAAAGLRARLAELLADSEGLNDPAWRKTVETVPRHVFVPGFYLEDGTAGELRLTRWRPVTEAEDRDLWLRAAYENRTLITQFDHDEPDWASAVERIGGIPTSSASLPSLVVRMWQDAELAVGHSVLEVGTGTGYSTALACELLGSDAVTSVEVDPTRLDRAAAALHACGYAPAIATADGLYGYAPRAPFDRIVAACSVRAIPRQWIAQTRPGGKILTTLGGWLSGYARALVTVHPDGTASGPLLAGTISFMPARAQEPPMAGNPAHWEGLLTSRPREARHSPDRINEPTPEAFFARFIAQCAAPDAQMSTFSNQVVLIDAVSGSAAALTRRADGWQVREGGPVALWERIERALDLFDAAGRPAPETFRLRIDEDGQRLQHPDTPDIRIASHGAAGS